MFQSDIDKIEKEHGKVIEIRTSLVGATGMHPHPDQLTTFTPILVEGLGWRIYNHALKKLQ